MKHFQETASILYRGDLDDKCPGPVPSNLLFYTSNKEFEKEINKTILVIIISNRVRYF